MSGLDKMKAQIIAEAAGQCKRDTRTGTRTGGFYNWGSKSTGRERCTEDCRTGRSQSRRFCETPGLFIRYEKAQGSNLMRNRKCQ